MRVGSVSGAVNYRQTGKARVRRNIASSNTIDSDVNFKGKFGQIVGGTIGTGAVVAASFLAAPAIICLAGAGLFAGLVGGDVIEDKINKEGEYKETK